MEEEEGGACPRRTNMSEDPEILTTAAPEVQEIRYICSEDFSKIQLLTHCGTYFITAK